MSKYAGLYFVIKKSTLWKEGIIHINNKPYYRFLPNQTNHISINKINNTHYLQVNNREIYKEDNNASIYSYTLIKNDKMQ
jgi:hypothetical protein